MDGASTDGKKKSTARRAPLPIRLLRLLPGPARQLLFAAALLAAACAACFVAWQHIGPRVIEGPEYQLTVENLHLPPLPDWIHCDVKTEALRDASLDLPTSIADKRLAGRIATALKMHPWVAQVDRVAIRPPAAVDVALVYRRPVCMVEVPGGLFPVDREGVLLPTGDFFDSAGAPLASVKNYARLSGVRTVPLGSVGAKWGDVAVEGGAQIADTLAEVWGDWNLQQIVATNPPAGHAEGAAAYFEVRTRGGTRIVWGPAPAAPGEAPPQAKLAKMKQVAADHGSLDSPNGPRVIDLLAPLAPNETRNAPTPTAGNPSQGTNKLR